MKHLRQHSSPQDSGILILSLAATIKDNQEFVNFASAFIRGSVSAAGMMVDAIDEHPCQTKISFDEFIALTDFLQYSSNTAAIESIQQDLLKTQISSWNEKVELAQKAEVITDADSIQSFIDEMIQVCEQVRLCKDLTLSTDDRFSMFLQLADNITDSRQSAVAQYYVALLEKTSRQLWNVPAG